MGIFMLFNLNATYPKFFARNFIRFLKKNLLKN